MTQRGRDAYELDCDVERAFEVLSGPGWAQARAAALSDGSRTVRREATGDGGVELVVSRELPDGTPGFLARFLPQDGRVEQTDTWGAQVDGARSGSWRADIPGAPARVGGTMHLEPAPAGCRYVVESEIAVSVPLIGGRAERFLVDMVSRLTASEAKVLRGLLGA